MNEILIKERVGIVTIQGRSCTCTEFEAVDIIKGRDDCSIQFFTKTSISMWHIDEPWLELWGKLLLVKIAGGELTTASYRDGWWEWGNKDRGARFKPLDGHILTWAILPI